MNPDPNKVDWDEAASSFAGEGRHELWRRYSDRVNSALLEAWLPERGMQRLLKTDLFDEATAEGLYPLLAKFSSRVDGVDIAATAVEAAARRYPELKTRQADLRDLPFEDQAFDCVVSNSTLDHFHERADIHRAVQELYRVTRPGGHLVITMDNVQNPLVWLRNHLPQPWLQELGLVPYFVGRSLTRSGLVDTLEQAGLDIIECDAVMHCPRVISVARATKIQERGDVQRQQRYLDRLQAWERLRALPSRYFTGHFIAVKARRPAQHQR